MPPVKGRLSASVDMDLLQYMEELYMKALEEYVAKRRKKPSWSSIVNEILELGIETHRRQGLRET